MIPFRLKKQLDEQKKMTEKNSLNQKKLSNNVIKRWKKRGGKEKEQIC